jgi:hypothetical protein
MHQKTQTQKPNNIAHRAKVAQNRNEERHPPQEAKTKTRPETPCAEEKQEGGKTRSAPMQKQTKKNTSPAGEENRTIFVEGVLHVGSRQGSAVVLVEHVERELQLLCLILIEGGGGVLLSEIARLSNRKFTNLKANASAPAGRDGADVVRTKRNKRQGDVSDHNNTAKNRMPRSPRRDHANPKTKHQQETRW